MTVILRVRRLLIAAICLVAAMSGGRTAPAPRGDGVVHVLDDFNDANMSFNDFCGNWGALNSDPKGECVSLSFDPRVRRGQQGYALEVSFTLPLQGFCGFWESLAGHIEDRRRDLDLTHYREIRFWVRSSGATSEPYSLKVELKQNVATGDSFDYTAYCRVRIDASNKEWTLVSLDADLTNGSVWHYNRFKPDPRHVKQMVFVLEGTRNPPEGHFWIDDVEFASKGESPFMLSGHSDDEFLNLVEEKTFRYFVDFADPDTGLVQDRATFHDLASTAATGFGLAALCVGADRGWVTRAEAASRVQHTLRSLLSGKQGPEPSGCMGYRGFFYHFLDAKTGLRKDKGSELSPVDTALLMMGVLTCKEYFADTPTITTLADQLYRRVEWDWMLDPAVNQFNLAWSPEQVEKDEVAGSPRPGFTSGHWDYYTDEAMLICLLAIGSPSHRVEPGVFYSWRRERGSYGPYHFIRSWNGSLFIHFFAHVWLDLRELGPDHHPTTPVDWWRNSLQAVQANRRFCIDHAASVGGDSAQGYLTYDETSWGLTACEGPDRSYRAYGAPQAEGMNFASDGTVAPYGAGSSILFTPTESIAALRHYFRDTALWSYRFGFGDAYNLGRRGDQREPWYHHNYFGIDQGPMLLAIENYRSGLIWKTVARSEPLSRAIVA
ncbi:MAG TPA: glucoamylase family protein, partial [Phycisphaerae bacterium]|nr:glucoamylase family protein [Phycisphaerae bacterium]